MRIRGCWLAPVILLIMAGLPLLNAQSITATLRGFVIDPQGAAMPSIAVKLTNTLTGQDRVSKTDERGEFIFSALQSGQYKIGAEASGFKTYEQKGIVLRVSQEVRNDIRMEVGNVTEAVQVTAPATLVSTNSSTIQTTADNQLLIEFGSIYNIIYLTPGVGTNTFLGRSINGGRPEQESVQLDGGDFMARISSGTHPQNTYPPADAIQEFTILTSGFKAEYGLGGVVVNAVTKSGTNTYHGTLWEYWRNDKLNARSFFSKTKPKLRNNQFGGDIGGPILKNRLFFYGLYNGSRNVGAASPTTNFVATAAERQGDFSQSAIKPIDPLNGQLFPSYQIPPSRIDPVATKLFDPKIVPLPNLGVNQLAFIVPGSTNSDQMLVKTDALFWSRNNLSVRLLKTYGTRGVSAGQLPAFSRNQNNRPSQAALSWIFTQSPTALNDFRFTANRISQVSAPLPDPATAADIGLKYFAESAFFPDFVVNGHAEIGRYNGVFANVSNSYQWTDNFSKMMGRHFVKTGMQVTRVQFNFLSEFFSAGGYSFNGTFSKNPLADLLLGKPSGFSQNSVSGGASRATIYSIFVQDDFRVNRRLTLNLGLRYDLQPWPSERDNKFLTFSQDRWQQGLRSKVFPTAPPGMVYVGDLGNSSGSLFGGTRHNKWGPRFGFAYDLTGDGRTSLRGSYGIFFEAVDLDRFAQLQAPPFMMSMAINAPNSFANPYLGQPNPNPFPYTPGASFDFTSLLPLSQRLPWPDYTFPYHQHWNLSLQRELFRDFLFSLAYVAQKGTHLSTYLESNAAVYIPGTNAQGNPLSTVANTNARRIYAPSYSGMSTDKSVGNNIYHSLQLSANKQFTKGLALISSYTWSHNIDDQTSTYGPIQRPLDLRGERASSYMDFRHRWTFAFVWQIPKAPISHHVLDRVVNGWQLDGNTQLQSGVPINILTGTDNSLTGLGGDRPNLVGNPILPDRPKYTEMGQWIDIAAFQPNAIGTFGNAGRNIITGPRIWSTSATVVRSFTIHEGHRLEFRWGMSNPFNNIYLTAPTQWTLSGAASFGVCGVSGPRTMSLGLKYLF